MLEQQSQQEGHNASAQDTLQKDLEQEARLESLCKLGHLIPRSGEPRRRTFRCLGCEKVFPSKGLEQAIAEGLCVPISSAHKLGADKLHTAIREGAVIAGHQLDLSHNILRTGAFYWCLKCGAWATSQPNHLKENCPQKPDTKGKEVSIARLSQGLPPKYGMTQPVDQREGLQGKRRSIFLEQGPADTAAAQQTQAAIDPREPQGPEIGDGHASERHFPLLYQATAEIEEENNLSHSEAGASDNSTLPQPSQATGPQEPRGERGPTQALHRSTLDQAEADIEEDSDYDYETAGASEISFP